MKIAFLVTSQGISGGHNSIFEHASGLQKRGHSVTIIGRSRNQFDFVHSWHDKGSELQFTEISEDSIEHFDIAIASNYESVFELHRVAAKTYAFFMQAFEYEFLPPSDLAKRFWLESVQYLGLPTLVVAQWMSDRLQRSTGNAASVVRNGIRKDLFLPVGTRVADPPTNGIRVLIEGPLGVAHKKVAETVEICLRSKAAEVWLLSSSQKTDSLPKEVRVFSNLPYSEVASVYRSCDLLVKLSTSEGMFGPPLEMFHCGGTAITTNVPGHEEYIQPNQNALVVPLDAIHKAKGLLDQLCANRHELDRLKQNALQTANQWRCWSEAVDEMEAALINLVNGTHYSREALRGRTTFLTRWHLVHQMLQRR